MGKAHISYKRIKKMNDKPHKMTNKEMLEELGRLRSMVIKQSCQIKAATEALEFYANTHIGSPNIDGTYTIYMSPNDAIQVSYTYDPNVAKRALKILKDKD